MPPSGSIPLGIVSDGKSTPPSGSIPLGIVSDGKSYCVLGNVPCVCVNKHYGTLVHTLPIEIHCFCLYQVIDVSCCQR